MNFLKLPSQFPFYLSSTFPGRGQVFGAVCWWWLSLSFLFFKLLSLSILKMVFKKKKISHLLRSLRFRLEMSTSQIRVYGLSPFSLASNPASCWCTSWGAAEEYLDPCHTHGRPRGSSRPLPLTWPSPTCWRHLGNESVNTRAWFLSHTLSLSLSVADASLAHTLQLQAFGE